MLDQVWNLEQYSWEVIIQPPVKLYCLPLD